jgi:hypothetical protein
MNKDIKHNKKCGRCEMAELHFEIVIEPDVNSVVCVCRFIAERIRKRINRGHHGYPRCQVYGGTDALS